MISAERKEKEAVFNDWLDSINFAKPDGTIIEPTLVPDEEEDPDA